MEFLKRIFTFGKHKAYEEGIQFYNNTQYPEAIEKFRKVLGDKHNPSSPYYTLARFYSGQAHRNLGEVFFATGDFLKASEEFEKALHFSPNNVELCQYLGICYGNLHDHRRSYEAFTKVMQQEPMSLSPGSKLSIVFHNLGVWDRAETTFVETLKANPGFSDVHFNLAMVHMAKGNAQLAIESLQTVLALNPQHTQAKAKLSISFAYLGKFDEAISTLLPVSQEFPSHADIQFKIGIIYAAKNETQKSIDHFYKAISINPRYKEARVKLGILLWCANKTGDGIRELEAASDIDPDDKPLKTAVRTLKKIGPEKNIAADPLPEYFPPVSCGKFITCQGFGRFINYFLLIPDFSDMLSILKAFPQDERFLNEKLIPILKETLELYPTYSDIHNSLGTFYLKTGQFEKAIASFRQARAINPNYIKARLNLFNVLKERGDLDEALREGDELLKANLPYPDFMCAVGEVYLSKNRYEAAEEIVLKALEKNPGFAPAHYLLAQVYHKKGDSDKATEVLKRCLDSDLSQWQF